MAITLTTSWQQILTFTETIDGYSGNVRQTLYAKYSRSSTQNNNLQSTISWELRTKVENGLTGAYYGYSKAYSITSKETSESSNITRYNGNINQGNINTTEKVLASGDWTQNHSSNGTCLVKINYSGYCYSVQKTGSVDIELPSIIVNPTLTINSSTNMTTSGSTINYTLGSTNGRTTYIQYSLNNSTWNNLHSKTADGTYNVTLPNLLSSFPNTYTPIVYFRAITSNGYSSGSKSKTITIDPSIKVNISSVTVSAVNHLTSLGNLFVKGLTKPKITTVASAGTGATISRYNLTEIGGYNSTPSVTNIGSEYIYENFLQQAGTKYAVVQVLDSRGNNSASSKASNYFEIIDYYNPSIQSLKAERCNQDGTLNDKGIYCKLTITYNIAPIPSAGNNYNKKKLYYSNNMGSSWVEIPINDYSGTVSLIIDGTYTVANSFVIYVQLHDINTIVTQYTTLPTSFVLVSKRAGGKAIAFGKISEAQSDEERVDIAMPTYFSERTHLIKDSGNTTYRAVRSDTNKDIEFGIGSGGINRGIYDNTLSKWLFYTSNIDTIINPPDNGAVLLKGRPLAGDNYNRGLAFLDEILPYIGNYTSDFNNYTETGFGLVQGISTNSPRPSSAGAFYGTMMVIKYATNYCTQLAIEVNSGLTYSRALINGNWGAWRCLSNVRKINFSGEWLTATNVAGGGWTLMIPFDNPDKIQPTLNLSAKKYFTGSAWADITSVSIRHYTETAVYLYMTGITVSNNITALVYFNGTLSI